MQNIIKKIPIFIIFLIPAMLVAGPALPDIVVSLSAVIFIYYCIKNSEYNYFKNRIFYIYSLFWLIIVLGSILSEHQLISLKSSFFHFRFLIFSFFIYYLISNYKNFLSIFYNFLYLTLIIVIFDGYIQFFFEKNLLGYEIPYAKQRLSGFFNDEWILGSYLLRTFPILLGVYFLLKNPSNIKKNLIIGITAPLIILIFLSGERAAFFLIILFILILIYFLKLSKLYKRFIFAALILFPLIIISINDIYKERMFNQILVSTGIVKEYPGKKKEIKCCFIPKYFFSYGHSKHFKTGFDMFLDKPILGYGVKSFRFDCKKFEVDFGCSTHPHNTYIQLLAETGIFGFSIIFFFFLYSCFLLIKNFLNRNKIDFKVYNARVCLLGCVIINLFPIIPSGSFFTNWLSILYFLPLGFLLYTYNYFDKYEKR